MDVRGTSFSPAHITVRYIYRYGVNQVGKRKLFPGLLLTHHDMNCYWVLHIVIITVDSTLRPFIELPGLHEKRCFHMRHVLRKPEPVQLGMFQSCQIAKLANGLIKKFWLCEMGKGNNGNTHTDKARKSCHTTLS
jgi:hypothetical protein